MSSAVETAITDVGITVAYRLAGTDRTQTAAQIATWATLGVPASGWLLGPGWTRLRRTLVHVANGANFPDALAAAQYAGATSR